MKSARTYLEYCCLSQVNRYFPKLGILSQILYCQNHSKIPPQNNQAQNAQSPCRSIPAKPTGIKEEKDIPRLPEN